MEKPCERQALRNTTSLYDFLDKNNIKTLIVVHLYSLQIEFLNSVKNLPNEHSGHLEQIQYIC